MDLHDVGPRFGGGGRGPTYGDGVVYAYGSTIIYAVDAKTGKAVKSFGDKGALSILASALAFKYPGKYPRDVNAQAVGYQMTTPPAYYNGILYVGTPFSENLIRGRLVIAVDGRTGAIKLGLRRRPRKARRTTAGKSRGKRGAGARLGGGIWTPRAINPESGLLT